MTSFDYITYTIYIHTYTHTQVGFLSIPHTTLLCIWKREIIRSSQIRFFLFLFLKKYFMFFTESHFDLHLRLALKWIRGHWGTHTHTQTVSNSEFLTISATSGDVGEISLSTETLLGREKNMRTEWVVAAPKPPRPHHALRHTRHPSTLLPRVRSMLFENTAHSWVTLGGGSELFTFPLQL